MVNIKHKNTLIEVKKGDIVKQDDVEAVVNAANSQLRKGGGVAGAIHDNAGSKLREETKDLAPITPGEAVITKGYKLPNKYIIHCLGPRYGIDTPEDKLLTKCYENALSIAEENNIKSISFPAISTGAFGYPTKKAAEISIRTVKNKSSELKLDLIRFVLFSEEDYKIYKKVIN